MPSSFSRAFSLQVLATVVLTASFASSAWAKKVSIEWKQIRGAQEYELQISQDGKTLVSKKLPETGWSGALDPGIYSYQIRGVDRLKRAGQWTQAIPLVVVPKPAEIESPSDGTTLVQYDPGAETLLEWSPVPGAAKYQVELVRGKTIVKSETTGNTKVSFKALSGGQYSWQVTAVFAAKGRAPASLRGKQWPGKSSEKSGFKVEYRKLEAPTPVSPLGILTPPSDGKLKLKWKSVEGAAAYEVIVVERAKSAGRTPAAERPVTRVVVTDNSTTVSISRDGTYAWRVRALAHVRSSPEADAMGPQSTADFKLDRNLKHFEGSGYVAISSMIAPYTYRILSPTTVTTGDAASAAVTLRLSGEYWFLPQWGVSAAVENTTFQLGDSSFARKGLELLGKYRISFGDAKRGWGLAPKVGIEGRDYFEIFPVGQASTIESRVYGVTAGLDLRKQITDKMSLGIKAAYFSPLKLTSSTTMGTLELASGANSRNISLGAQMLYWLSPRWGLGAGAYLEKRSISYRINGVNTSSDPEQVFMDGTYFFGSLLYSFGH